jgi:hypothetical protein
VAPTARYCPALGTRFLAFAGTKLLAIESRQTTLPTVTTGAVLGVLLTISSVGAGALGVTALLLL